MSKKNFLDQQETNVYSRIIILRVKVFLEKHVRVRDPIHGMVELNEGEAAIIKKEAFQRLFARYWMFIQVYFHKTRRIYDYYLTAFLKDFLQWKQYPQRNGYFPPPDNLNDYLALDDCTILEAIKKFRNSNEWARRIFERDHLSETFVTFPQHTGLANYLAVAELKEKFEEKYGSNPQTAHVDDKARRLLTNPFFGLKKQEEGDKEAEGDRKFDSIVVQDKHNPEQYYSIFGQSLPLQLLSQKNINIVRFYVTRNKKGSGNMV